MCNWSVGLVQREIEAAGMSTITLSNIPDLTAAVHVPRQAGIEYPFGRTLGRPGDATGQMAVLRATLQALQQIQQPGGRVDLPFEWPEPPREANTPLPELPPIFQYLKKHITQVRNFMNRDIPKEFRVSDD
jgi:D-proline reductase (dithiol) PrdB